jgi:hypothetical protein
VRAGTHAHGYAGGLTPARLLRDAGAPVVHQMQDLVAVLGTPVAEPSNDADA